MLVTLEQPPSAEALRSLPLSPAWAEVSQEIRDKVLDACDWVSIKPGDVLISEGESGDCAYLLVSGRLVVIHDNDPKTVLREVRAGDWVGEIALLTREARSATVIARRGALLARLSNDAFDALVAEHPELMVALSRWTILNLSGKKPGPSRADGVLAVIPASRGCPLDRFIASLSSALGEHRRVEVIDGERAFGLVGNPAQLGPAECSELRARLSVIENEVDWLLVVADDGPTPWSQLCIQEADRVLMVAEADAAPGRWTAPILPGDIVRAPPPRELVVLHPRGARRASGTRSWLDRLGLDMHHNVRHDDRGDFARLARFISGSAIGLALAGGAARGLTHLGVLRALEEAKIPIDLLCGTSVGAAAAGFYAMSDDLDTIIARSYEGFAHSTWRLLDLTVPVRSLLGGRTWASRLEDIFGDAQIEDLWPRFFCVSCSLADAAPFVHRRGPMREAVACSSAVPGLLPPVIHNGTLHIDGCVLDNLPALRAKEYGAGRVIAVDLIPAADPLFAPRQAPQKGLFSRLRSYRSQPLLQDIIMRGLFLAPVYASAKIKQEVDLFIEPDVSRFHLLEFGAFHEMVEAGYRAATRALEGWDPGP